MNSRVLKQWQERKGKRKISFKVVVVSAREFTFDAWDETEGEHVGVHSPHSHRPYFHLQVQEPGGARVYEKLPANKALRYYAQIFERQVRKAFGVNAWQTFS